MASDLTINSHLTIPAALLTWVAVRSSGPGGQNVNKVATKVELRFELPSCTTLPLYARARLRILGKRYLTSDGSLLIASQVTRSQERNLEDARQRLATLVRQALERPKYRKPTKPSRGAKERRLKAKKTRGQTKRLRGRVRRDDD